MIWIELDERSLGSKIAKEAPNWTTKAAARLAECKKASAFVKRKTEIWGDVKWVLMEAQHFKCAYCERPLPKSPGAAVEHDVEHYRPKSQVTAWPSAAAIQRLSLKYPKGFVRSGRAKGYWWLAHAPMNYAMSCKTCNSSLKGDRFPIDATPLTGAPKSAAPCASDVIAANAAERPLLIFPIKAIEATPPEALIQHEGVVPIVGKGLAKYDEKRARVTIDFFELVFRPELIEGRFRQITGVAAARKLADSSDRKEREYGKELLEWSLGDEQPFAACARAFDRRQQADKKWAFEIATIALRYLKGKEPNLPNVMTPPGYLRKPPPRRRGEK